MTIYDRTYTHVKILYTCWDLLELSLDLHIAAFFTKWTFGYLTLNKSVLLRKTLATVVSANGLKLHVHFMVKLQNHPAIVGILTLLH